MPTKVAVLTFLVVLLAIGLAPNAVAVAADGSCEVRCSAPPECPPDCCCCPCPLCGGDDCIVCDAIRCAMIALRHARETKPAPAPSAKPACDLGGCCGQTRS
ncbi:MAG: hypothetical protein HYR85_08515 [Planctomycetes bacterium]|nr:hypothetical protein [Planctomycetota bacterium]MBI3846732.1 hypothetical protein [Planctomycetota bacterium]